MNLGDRMNFDNLIIGQTPRTSNESQNFIINEPMDHRNLSFIEPKEPRELYNPINQANPRNLDILIPLTCILQHSSVIFDGWV